MELCSTSLTGEQIKNRIYNGRMHLLRKCNSRIRSNQQLLIECRRYPFINQVLELSKLAVPLTDEEKTDAIDAILASGVYERVKEEEQPQATSFSYIDQLVIELLKWFKEEFFVWVNKLGCSHCGNEDQNQIRHMAGCRPYKEEHYRGKASVIERYQCLKCQKIYEFPRYNDIRTLLLTRKGRCGEWNNCFIAILRSLDIDVRYIWNAEDHVWCEYYSEKQKRWIHLDACENAYDQPLLYNTGWGKKMSYVFAVKESYIVDVTDRYLDPKKPEAKLPKNKAPEQYLQAMLTLSNSIKLTSASREIALTDTSRLIGDFRNTAGGYKEMATDSTTKSMKPRQSGGATWTKQRGEAGKK
ncbi:hypothetical protein PICMEDRAFT_15226 [Pichia membranifaciens NRRL Y-2026]|uniref:Peptide:N-glycanase 1 n=1 Tax=Pichia membranifaciens NRRL Y-2026 TaxID=763406 RepID=A0A1E3NM87_9ASCO|nr:hypothetical protein PICMEDRAFT_15226 [Pichia membranifaciens NRRL Y-2026]ODQ47244.1 hypothetical protein PICMEDRAFT_15226 [Pichia membranifaciens NRRL Y-2026]